MNETEQMSTTLAQAAGTAAKITAIATLVACLDSEQVTLTKGRLSLVRGARDLLADLPAEDLVAAHAILKEVGAIVFMALCGEHGTCLRELFTAGVVGAYYTDGAIRHDLTAREALYRAFQLDIPRSEQPEA